MDMEGQPRTPSQLKMEDFNSDHIPCGTNKTCRGGSQQPSLLDKGETLHAALTLTGLAGSGLAPALWLPTPPFPDLCALDTSASPGSRVAKAAHIPESYFLNSLSSDLLILDGSFKRQLQPFIRTASGT